jgi:hypothetical protein
MDRPRCHADGGSVFGTRIVANNKQAKITSALVYTKTRVKSQRVLAAMVRPMLAKRSHGPFLSAEMAFNLIINGADRVLRFGG